MIEGLGLTVSIGGLEMPVTHLVLLAASIAALAMVWFQTRGRARRALARIGDPAKSSAVLLKEKSAARDVERVMMELDQTARRIHGRLDLRLSKLESVLHEADRRIEDLTRLVRQANGQPGLDVTLPAESPVAAPSGVPAKNDPHALIHQLSDEGLSPVEIAKRLHRQPGEIELILALHHARETADSSA
jgi:hypothetical protein